MSGGRAIEDVGPEVVGGVAGVVKPPPDPPRGGTLKTTFRVPKRGVAPSEDVHKVGPGDGVELVDWRRRLRWDEEVGFRRAEIGGARGGFGDPLSVFESSVVFQDPPDGVP